MPQNRLLAIFDHFLNSVTLASPDDQSTINPVAKSLLDALEKHLGSTNPSSSRKAPLMLQNQVLSQTVTVSNAVADVLARLGAQASVTADWILPSSISTLLQAIGMNMKGIADRNGEVGQSMLHTCVYLACFIAYKGVPKEDEKEITQRLEVVLDELTRIPGAQQPISPTTLSPDSAKSYLVSLGDKIRDRYSGRSPSMYHPQLPPSPYIQDSALSPTSTSSNPLESQANESYDPISTTADINPSSEQSQVATAEPPNTITTENGHDIHQSDPPSSSGASRDLGIFMNHTIKVEGTDRDT
jgi:hypothetical protein